MAKIKLTDINFGLDKKPEINPAEDSKTLLETAFDREKGEYADIPVAGIVKNPHNDYAENDKNEEIAELAADIKHNGLLHNIVVTPQQGGGYLLLSGERRLRAYEWLLNTEKDNKYSVIHAKILNNLNETEQMIILDAANLHTRGGVGGETRFRKAMVRFVKNLQLADRISEDEAKKMTAETFESIDKRLIDSNISIENNLIPELLKLLDEDIIPKRQAVLYARLDGDTQRGIAAAVETAREQGRGALKEVNDRLKDEMKKVGDLSARLENHEREADEVASELDGARQALKELDNMEKNGADGRLIESQRAEIKQRIKALTQEKNRYLAAISEAKKALDESRGKMTEKPNHSDKTAVAAMINKNISRVVASVNNVASLQNISCISSMDAVARSVAVERLTAAKKQLEKMLAEIGKDGK